MTCAAFTKTGAGCKRVADWSGFCGGHRPAMGRNRLALEKQLSALGHDRVVPAIEALVEASRSLADLIDADPLFDDKAWREYRLMLGMLTEATNDDGTDDTFARLLAEMSTAVGDPPES